MPEAVIKNYASEISKNLKSKTGTISLVSYDNYDLTTTLDPDKLSSFFSGNSEKRIYETLTIFIYYKLFKIVIITIFNQKTNYMNL
jgi:hypothetical protein